MIFGNYRKNGGIPLIGGKAMSEIHLLNACKLDWEETFLDFHVESIAFRIKTLINLTLFR